jgi:hypothetical protein
LTLLLPSTIFIQSIQLVGCWLLLF